MKTTIDYPISYLNQYCLTNKKIVCDDTFDLIYVLSGQIQITFPGEHLRTYNSSQITTLHSNQEYRLAPNKDNIILHLALKSSFIEEYIGRDNIIICDSILEPNKNYILIKQILSSIAAKYFDNSASHRLSIYGLLFQLVDHLIKEHTILSNPDHDASSPKFQERITDIISFINQNYNMGITLNSLSEQLFISPQYLSKFFKMHFKINFKEYLNNIKLQYAVRDLCYTNESITDIALKHGFSNIATFNKQFRLIYEDSPRDYRKSYQKHQSLDYDFSRNKLELSRLIEDDTLNRRDIIGDVTTTRPLPHNYCHLINLGFVKNLLSGTYQQQFIAAHKELRFKYVRLEGLISNALIPRLVNGNEYYFANVATILDFLYEQKVIPFLELGKNSFDYTQRSESAHIHHGYSTNKKFQAMLNAFLEFVTSRYQPSWYRQWIFELWKPPTESASLYLDGYKEILQILHTYISDAKLGGPGHNTALSSDDFIDCLNAFKKSGIVPDFISIHLFSIQYSMDLGKNNLLLPPDQQFLIEQQRWIRTQIKEFIGMQIPLYITEFNSSLLPDTFINSSCYQAAFVCHHMLKFHETSDLIGYWQLSEFAFHPNVQNRNLSGNISLIDKNGLRLPSYHTYTLLNRLGTELIEQGDNFCITKSIENHYQILSYHYSHLTNYEKLHSHSRDSLRDTYTLYEEVTPVKMSFHLKGMKPGTYRICRYLLDRSHGSLLDIILGGLHTSTIDEDDYLYKTQSLSKETMEYLSKTCIPEERTIYLTVEEELNVETTLAAHDVCFWDIVFEI